jgi:DNA repair exonuclease SbcCD ATPase subunit
MKTTDDGKALTLYSEAQDEIAELLTEIPKDEAAQQKEAEVVKQLRAKMTLVEHKIQTLKNEVAILEQKKFEVIDKIKALAAEIAKMNNAEPGVRCKTCLMEADPTSFAALIAENQGKIDALQAEVDNVITPKAQAKKEEFCKVVPMLELVDVKIKETEALVAGHARDAQQARARVFKLQQVKKPEAGADALLIEQQIATLKAQAKDQHAELTGPSPFDKIRTSAQVDVEKKKIEYETKKSQIQEAERFLPYYEYWVTAFGDSGIRKHVIDGIIEPLNERISFWLNYLIYGNISLKFDNELEETIQRVPIDGDDPFVYEQMSGGEQRRLNLSVPLSFAHCMELSSGSSPSVVFLDEVAVNIDENGIEGIYNMIRELATDKQVFVTDHNPLLLDLLQGQDLISLERRDRITKLVA